MLTTRSSRRRLRPGDDRVLHADTQSARTTLRSAQRSQIDSDENSYESAGPLGLPIESSAQSHQSGIFGPNSGSTMPNEQALVGHTMDQFGNRPTGSFSYPHRSMSAYSNEPAEANFYGHDAGRLLSVLSEAAENLDYSATTSLSAAPRRAMSHASAASVTTDLRYRTPSFHGQFPCRYPGCNKVMAHECDVPYGHQISTGL